MPFFASQAVARCMNARLRAAMPRVSSGRFWATSRSAG